MTGLVQLVPEYTGRPDCLQASSGPTGCPSMRSPPLTPEAR